MIVFSNSFRAKIVVACALALVLTNAPLIAVDVLNERDNQRSSIKEANRLATSSLARTVALPLWDFNYPFLENLFDGLEESESIARAKLFDVSGRLLAEYKNETLNRPSWADSEFVEDVVYSSGTGQEKIGTLSITFSGASAEAAVRSFMYSRMRSFALLCFLVTALLILVLNKVLAPLGTLVASIKRIEEGKLDHPVQDVARTDEIGRVAQALEQLRLVEQKVLHSRRAQDSAKLQERHRILRALQSTDNGVVVLDEKNRVVLQNRRSEELFGLAVEGAHVCELPILWTAVKAQSKDGNEVHTIALPEGTCSLRVRKDTIRDEDGTSLGHVVLASDVTEQFRQQVRADYLADHDVLTGLPNRRAFESDLAELEGGSEAALMLCDIDCFKKINDGMGHGTGDGLLRYLADTIRDVSDVNMLPVRLGGDEFAVLARGKDAGSRLEYLGDTLLEKVSDPVQIEGKSIAVGVSVGIARMPRDASNVSQLLQLADAALYRAKREGRGQLHTVQPDLVEEVARRKLVEKELRQSLEDGRGPIPVLQMQTDANTRELKGFEALSRWRLSSGEVSSPGEFIPLAEEVGLIGPLTQRILNCACRTLVELQRRGFNGRIAVNASPILFDGTISTLVETAIVQSDCLATGLEIEVTEQVVLTDREEVFKEIEKLRKIGVSIALDDFGMGYSSLSYLQKYPIDKIKIDRAFVEDVVQSEETNAIVRAIVDMSRALGISVTAEGAETEETRYALADCGVDTIQGWVDGKPFQCNQLDKLYELFEQRTA